MWNLQLFLIFPLNVFYVLFVELVSFFLIGDSCVDVFSTSLKFWLLGFLHTALSSFTFLTDLQYPDTEISVIATTKMKITVLEKKLPKCM